jgi:tetratricopeptide (TPR) repeat protein
MKAIDGARGGLRMMKRILAVFLALLLGFSSALAQTQAPLPRELKLLENARSTGDPVEIQILTLYKAGDKGGAYEYIKEQMDALMAENPLDKWDGKPYYCSLEEQAIYEQRGIETGNGGYGGYPILLYYLGFLLVDDQDYENAAKVLGIARGMDPARIATLMERVNCNIATRDLEGALSLLDEARGLCLLPEDIAWYYRRLGYILCEQGDYALSKHCQLYSLIFEDSAMAYSELEFLDSVSGGERFDYRRKDEAFDHLTEEAVRDLDSRGMLFRFGEDQKAMLTRLSGSYAGADPELYDRALAFYEALDGEVRVM